jgi:hypothetical protein
MTREGQWEPKINLQTMASSVNAEFEYLSQHFIDMRGTCRSLLGTCDSILALFPDSHHLPIVLTELCSLAWSGIARFMSHFDEGLQHGQQTLVATRDSDAYKQSIWRAVQEPCHKELEAE